MDDCSFRGVQRDHVDSTAAYTGQRKSESEGRRNVGSPMQEKAEER